MVSLQVPNHVRHRSEEHGGVIILDTEAGEWITLNETAGSLWRCWEAGAEFDQGVDDVAGRYPGVPRESIRADASQLLEALLGRGIIDLVRPAACEGAVAAMAAPGRPAPGTGPGWFRVVLAVLALAVADIIARCSFRWSLALVRLTRQGWCHRVPTTAQAARTVAAVNAAARWYPARAACLEQSLAAVLLAAAGRRRLDWCLGSIPDPYRFHAWVAVAGEPVPGQGSDSDRSQFDLLLAT